MRYSIWITTILAIGMAVVLSCSGGETPSAPLAPAPGAGARPNAKVLDTCIEWTHTADLQFYRNDNTRIDGDSRERSVTVVSTSGTGPTNEEFFTNSSYGLNYNRWRDEQGTLVGRGSSRNTWGYITSWSSSCSVSEQSPPIEPDPEPQDVNLDPQDKSPNSSSPMSKDFSVEVTPGEYVGVVQSWVFPFTEAKLSPRPLKSVIVVDLPDSDQGRLVLETRYRPPNRPPKRSRISAVVKGQEIPNDVTRTRAQGKPFLYFHASNDFTGAEFQFKVVDTKLEKSSAYVATLSLPPPTSADFTVQANPNEATYLTQSVVFPFSDLYGKKLGLGAVEIVLLPAASQGRLMVETRYVPPKRTIRRYVSARQVIPSDAKKTREQGKPFLYFVAKSAFSSATFTFKVVAADDGVESEATYTATLERR